MTALLDRTITDDLTRRQLLGAGGVAALGFGLGACATGPAASAPDTPSAAGFPVRVDGRFGPTIVPRPPQRVVALGMGPDEDAALALGMVPVAAAASDSLPGGAAPWVTQVPGGAAVEQVDTTAGLPFERIAALRPDLIVATTAYSLERDHDRLSAIAPVLAFSTGPNTDRWQDTTRRVGHVLGRDAQAEQTVRDVENRIAQARARHPQLDGRTFTFGPVTPDGSIYTTNTTADLSAGFLQQLGLRLSPRAQALAPSGTRGKALVSPEVLDAIDADVMVLTYTTQDPAVRKKVEGSPLFTRLPAVRRGSYVAVDLAAALGMAFPSALSLGYVLDHIVDTIAAAVR